MKTFLDYIFKKSTKLEQTLFVRTIRGGLISIIPILLIGSFALIFKSFPIQPYQDFIQNFGNGFLFLLFNMIYAATFSMLSIYMTLAIGINYQKECQSFDSGSLGAPLSSLLCFFILSGVFHEDFSISVFSAKGMPLAIISGFFASMLFCQFNTLKVKLKTSYTDGADYRFNTSISSLIPVALTAAVFVIIHEIVIYVFHVNSFYDLILKAFDVFFVQHGNTFGNGLLFVITTSILWFFGIHGSDCLESVMQQLYTPAIQKNLDALALGHAPTEILTKPFFDTFILMGGCGTAISLLISLRVFGTRKSDKSLSRLSAIPVIFNINELLIFGLPVILNPIMFLPFILTPVICYLNTYFAMSQGLVAYTTNSIEWTTPIILGGYMATGSINGSILQIINVLLGVFIYAPFIRILDRQKVQTAKDNYEKLVQIVKEDEINRTTTDLVHLPNSNGEIAKLLILDLKACIEANSFSLYYQPQYSNENLCIGAETLLRWNHELFGMIYPPLMIRLAKEAELLTSLEYSILTTALEHKKELDTIYGHPVKLSINLTGDTLCEPTLLPFLETLRQKYTSFDSICLEITEQTAVKFDAKNLHILDSLKQMGFLLAIDDFSMGQTSINYLKNNYFNLIKLDGSLVTGILDNHRCLEIISSIVSLASTLGLDVIAEFVETKEQRDALEKIGCYLYQGYLYSPALPLEKLKE